MMKYGLAIIVTLALLMGVIQSQARADEASQPHDQLAATRRYLSQQQIELARAQARIRHLEDQLTQAREIALVVLTDVPCNDARRTQAGVGC